MAVKEYTLRSCIGIIKNITVYAPKESQANCHWNGSGAGNTKCSNKFIGVRYIVRVSARRIETIALTCSNHKEYGTALNITCGTDKANQQNHYEFYFFEDDIPLLFR